jgi:hypothetical protein
MDFKTKYLKYKNKYLELKNGMNKVGGFRLNFQNEKNEIKSVDFTRDTWIIKEAGKDVIIANKDNELYKLKVGICYDIINKNTSTKNCMNCVLVDNQDWKLVKRSHDIHEREEKIKESKTEKKEEEDAKIELIKENSITYFNPLLKKKTHLDLRNPKYTIKNAITNDIIEKNKSNFTPIGLLFNISYNDSTGRQNDILNCILISENWV